MHDAFEPAPILERLPLHIESISSFESTLLLGTREGVLLQYKVQKSKTKGDNKFDVQLERSNKSFAKKPITQLAAVPELFILISLSDNVISVHDLATVTLITCVNKTKGASLFAVDVQKRQTANGVEPFLRIGIASKRKIQLFYWQNRDFVELLNDLSLYDFPHALTWCKDSLCVGFKRDYYIINSKTGNLKELFPVGSNQKYPIVTRLFDNRLALGRDAMSILINSEGDPTQKEPINWSDIPQAMEHSLPYLVAILPKFVEVRTIDPKMLIQNITLPDARYICQGDGCLYVASQNTVWRLVVVPYSSQIKQLLQSKEFELALKLAELADEAVSEKEKRIRNIKNLYAFDLFCQRRFGESLSLFAKLGTDPSHVIGLYPNLLPQGYRNNLSYPEKVPDLQGSEYERGIMALIEYLTQKRTEVMKDMGRDLQTTAIVEGNKTIKPGKQLSQIIDTTLLKCYLQTNDALVAPLLRLKDNHCHVVESERVLMKKEKFSELIILYQTKGLHQKALTLLMKQAARPESPLKGHERTVMYLQHLEDLPEVESLPRDIVLDYLEKISTDLALPYLEHVVLDLKDPTDIFHDRLVDLYRQKVQLLRDEYIHSLPEGHPPSKVGEEPGELGEARKKLVSFLHTSKSYIPERLLTHFPTDGFYEERAILLGRLGRHEQALSIYIHTLNDTRKAEEFCAQNYDRDREGNKDVYYLLLKIFLKPPDGAGDDVTNNIQGLGRRRLEVALKLLEDHAMKIDTAKALELLPHTTKLRDILTFLENVMENQAVRRRHNQVLKSMLYAENLQVTLFFKTTLHLNRELINMIVFLTEIKGINLRAISNSKSSDIVTSPASADVMHSSAYHNVRHPMTSSLLYSRSCRLAYSSGIDCSQARISALTPFLVCSCPT
ncbi:vam6/vps39-like protein [Plakobranchus ocellatus]|uniref:Vam6/vps39-like protein n=1 Tax=Plakobranchus ocellatus TaxID=259542 RepID=A0AAV3ZTA7_9GAST|nr:vam6/vps39-like protein [Plakobranchus ocellatus]